MDMGNPLKSVLKLYPKVFYSHRDVMGALQKLPSAFAQTNAETITWSTENRWKHIIDFFLQTSPTISVSKRLRLKHVMDTYRNDQRRWLIPLPLCTIKLRAFYKKEELPSLFPPFFRTFRTCWPSISIVFSLSFLGPSDGWCGNFVKR